MKFEERYTLQVPLGETARGTVWSARDERLKRPVVVAVVESDAPKGTATRFLHAWEHMVSARHPALPRLVESGITQEDAPFVAMELAEGESLAARLTDGPPLRIDHLTRALVEVSDGLAALHAKGGVHGDVEPSNVLLRERGGRLLPKIVGLGLGRAAVRTGHEPLEDAEHLPTLAFMSPKQASGHDAAPADDAYSMAAVLYSAVTGRLPHHGESADAIRAHARDESVPRVADVRPDLEGPLADVIDNALAADVRRRFSDCASLSKALRAGLLKSRGLGGFHTELGERSLAPGAVVSKPRTMPPPRPVVSLPRPVSGPGGTKGTRSTLKGRPTLERPAPMNRPAPMKRRDGGPSAAVKGSKRRPTSPPPPNRPMSSPPPRPDGDLGFERLSGILEIPDLDELAGPPPFSHAAVRSAPPPPPQAKRSEASGAVAKKSPTSPPPPPSPLGLQALGSASAVAAPDIASSSSVVEEHDAGEDELSPRTEDPPSEADGPTRSSEHAPDDNALGDGAEQDGASGDGGTELPGGDTGEGAIESGAETRGRDVDFPDAGSADAAPAESADLADAAAAQPAKADAGTSEAGTSEAGTSEAGTSDAGTSDAGTSDAATSVDADLAAPELDELESGEGSDEPDLGLVPPPLDHGDSEPAVAPLNLQAPVSDPAIPLQRGALPMWVWAAAGLLVAAVLGGAMLWLGGDDEETPAVVVADSSSPAERVAPEPAPEPDPAPEPAVEPSPVSEPEPPAPTVIHLTGVPAGAAVFLDGERLPAGEGIDELTLDPLERDHVLRVTQAGFRPFEATLSRDSVGPVDVVLEPLPAPVPRPVATGRRSPATGRRATSRRGTGSRSTGSRSTGSRSTGSRSASGRRRPVAVTDPGF
ncbi:MAG: protein kinase [Sandaracinaceae bacterium]